MDIFVPPCSKKADIFSHTMLLLLPSLFLGGIFGSQASSFLSLKGGRLIRLPMELMITREDGKFVITNLVLDAIGLGDSVNEAINDLMEYMIDQYKLLKKFHDDDRLTQYAKRLFEKYKLYLEERS